jgi:hypothetical protein
MGMSFFGYVLFGLATTGYIFYPGIVGLISSSLLLVGALKLLATTAKKIV